MATEAQIAANRDNAKSSTGPVTDAGKARAARNAASFGLFSAPGFAPPGEEEHYARFREEYGATLAPQGALENTLAAEIIHSAWRLRRCVQIEASFDALDRDKTLMTGSADLDAPYVETRADALLRSIQRARANAQRTFHRSIAELRRLQTERCFRREFLPKGFDPSGDGIGSFKETIPVMTTSGIRRQMEERNGGSFFDILRTSLDKPLPNFAERSQLQPSGGHERTPRNAACPCGSGRKFKRCCARIASPPLAMAA